MRTNVAQGRSSQVAVNRAVNSADRFAGLLSPLVLQQLLWLKRLTAGRLGLRSCHNCPRLSAPPEMISHRVPSPGTSASTDKEFRACHGIQSRNPSVCSRPLARVPTDLSARGWFG